jgi:DNA-binding SARP family transcriptional activator/tetratricopeptide (TPR) repeat protein
MVCRLSLLGPPRLLDEKGRLISVPAKTYALVAYLLLNGRGGPASRASLRQFLWEDSDAKTAATNLRKFLSRLIERQDECGCEMIKSRRDHVELATGSVQVDLAEFLKIVECPRSADLVALCDLYRGDLLDGCEFEGGDVQDWLNLQRGNLREAFVSVIAGRLEPLDPGTDKVVVRVAARKLLEVDPYNEVGHRALMRLFAEGGETARVRDIYRSLEERLHGELGTVPDAATTELHRTLLPASPIVEKSSPAQPVEASSPAHAVPAHEEGEHALDTQPAAAPRRSGAPRVTVLPPAPIAGQEYGHQLAVSLIEDVTIGLCRSKALSVVAPHTAWELSQGGKKALFRTFGIEYAVETKLQNRGGELWLAVQLLNALTRNILWVEQYKFDPTQMAWQYRELSTQIVLLLVDAIERTELTRYEVEQDPTAYHLFLAGQRFLRKLDLPHVRRARRAFRLSINSCPDFVPAISGLAQTFSMEWLLMARGDRDLVGEAERLAQRSLEIDPEDARGYRNLGLCHLYGGRFDESLEAFDNAEQRNPQHADLLVDFADALQHACEPRKALEKINGAIQLNPLCPDWYWWVAGGVNYHLEQYSDSIDCISRMRDKSPAFRLAAASWAMLGEREKAGEYVRMARDIHPDFSVNAWLSILPIKDPEFARRYEQGLREAGFN